jgi:hypothetical protein
MDRKGRFYIAIGEHILLGRNGSEWTYIDTRHLPVAPRPNKEIQEIAESWGVPVSELIAHVDSQMDHPMPIGERNDPTGLSEDSELDTDPELSFRIKGKIETRGGELNHLVPATDDVPYVRHPQDCQPGTWISAPW